MNETSERYDGIVICSTQNQMVNYLTILQHFAQQLRDQTLNIINITSKNPKNKKWDENLENSLGIQFKECIRIDSLIAKDHKTIESIIESKIGKKANMLWNITGGQRHVVMAITNYLNKPRAAGEEEDSYTNTIVYFEGNQNKFYYYANGMLSKEERILSFNHDELNIQIALRLMGFELTNDKTDKSGFYQYLIAKTKNDFISGGNNEDTWEILERERRLYLKLYDKLCKNLGLLKILMKTNIRRSTSQNNGENDNGSNSKISKLERLTTELREKSLLDEDNLGVLNDSLYTHKNACLFGFILEYIVFYKFIDVLKKDDSIRNEIIDITMSAKTLNETAPNIIDEFDIILLTRSGKIIIFECKSGYFDGDDMKSHHYSTYSVAGVYGAPILITPFTEKSTQTPKGEEDEKIIQQFMNRYNYAQKANVDYWYLDDLETKLKQLLMQKEEESCLTK